MKKLILLFAIIALMLGACSKKDNTTSTNPTTPAPTITAVPTTFTQQVLIEEFTACWCGWCPDGITAIKQADSMYPGKINAVAFQDGDVMTTPQIQTAYSALMATWSVSGIPATVVNRTSENGFGEGQYPAPPGWLNSALDQTPVCGVALDATASTTKTLSVKVYAGFNQPLTGSYRLIVYLIENPVTNTNSQYNQENYQSSTGSSPNPSSPWYSQPPSMSDFAHPHVLREILSADQNGDSIPSTSLIKGGEYTKTYTFANNSSAWDYSNLYFVVAIYKYGTTTSDQQIMNSQVVKVGSLQNWN